MNQNWDRMMKGSGKNTMRLKAILMIVGFLTLFAGMEIGAEEQQTAAPGTRRMASSSGANGGRSVSIDFNNVDIHVFIKFISELTGKNFVVDDKVKGKVTIISPAKISEEEAYKVFESVLEVHGYATVEAGEVIKIVSSPDARTKSVETLIDQAARAPEDKVVTQIIPLKYANADEIKRLVAPLVSKSSVVLSYDQTNMLIITDFYSNINRLMQILSAIDVTGIGREISIIPLESADAAKMVKILETIFKEQQQIKGKAAGADSVSKFVADERTNTIILLASELETARAKKLIRMLDKEVPRGKEKIHVYYLEYAVAEDMAKVLQMLPTKEQATAKGKKVAPVVSSDTKITADKATNSLIIMAEKDDYLAMEEIIKKLDIPRSMVYIECLIMEVDADAGLNLGTEWQVGAEVTDDQGREGVYGGGFSGDVTTPYSNIGNVVANNVLPGGMSVGIFGESIDINGVQFPSIAAIVQAAKNRQDTNILSTPQLITTDNQEASITVGKNVPFLTKTGTTSASETYNNYEYKDVGKTLKITPQISKEKLVRLAISLEVTALDTAAISTLADATTPTTFKRTIDTTVIVNDQNTVVIGGLIDETISNSQSTVPCLSDVPLLGWLFKSISESNEKTNLYIFLKPYIIKNPEDVEELRKVKKEEINNAVEEGKIKLYGDSMEKQTIITEP